MVLPRNVNGCQHSVAGLQLCTGLNREELVSVLIFPLGLSTGLRKNQYTPTGLPRPRPEAGQRVNVPRLRCPHPRQLTGPAHRGAAGRAARSWCNAGFGGAFYGFFRNSNKMPEFALAPAAIAGSSTLNFGL